MRNLLVAILMLCASASATAPFSSLTTDWSNATTTTFTTASVTPTANNVVMFATASHLAASNGPQPVSSVAGNSLVWTQIAGLDYGATTGTARVSRLELWCGIGATPTGGAITLTWSTSPTLVTWSVLQSAGLPNSCTTAFNANIVTNAANVATISPLTATMGAFASPGNATLAIGAVDNGGQSVGPGTSMTEISQFTAHQPMLETEFSTGNVSPATATYGGPTVVWGIIALEIVPLPFPGHKPLSF